MESFVSTFCTRFLTLFYIVPIKHDFKEVNQVPDYIDEAVPFFIIMCFIELIAGYMTKKTAYTFKDTIMSFSLGLEQQLLVAWFKSLKVGPYVFVYHYFENARQVVWDALPFQVDFGAYNPLVQFLIGMLACDFCYYAFHRMAHEYHIMWVGHSVHHSGERYNVATALRQGMAQLFFVWIAFLPIAALGVRPVEYVRHFTLNIVYQFWIHTEYIGRLPLLLEFVLNTPSHHRVHHHPPGNCNYAGVLIIWDRIFCTFIPEVIDNVDFTKDRVVAYGLARPLTYRHDPLYANVAHVDKIYQSQKYQLQESASSFVEIKSWINTFGFLMKKRVDVNWRVAASIHELLPEISSNTRISDYVTFAYTFVPPYYTDEIVTKSEKDGVKKDDNPTAISFIKQRGERDGSSLSTLTMALISVQFVATLVFNIYITTVAPSLLASKQYMTLLGLCVVCGLSTQIIQYFY